MIKLNRLRLEIISSDNTGSDKYGFDIPFYSGLNIIAGENSKGKSTIGSCIYYALGMEELLELGALNEKALGKAVKKEFELTGDDGSVTSYRVLFSRIFLEIQNDSGEIATISRFINSNDLDIKGNDLKTKKVQIYHSTFEDISPAVRSTPLFIRNYRNNEDEYGFYHWLADFIGLEIPEVLNTSSKGRSPLYLQAIFTAIFIEQTKGWSDIMATMPYFGITRPKEKVFEFLLKLKELNVATQRDFVERKEKQITHKWDLAINRLDLLASEFDGVLKDFPNSIIGDPDDLKTVSFVVLDESDNIQKTISSLHDKYSAQLAELLVTPIKKVGENKSHVRERLEHLYSLQQDFMKKYEEFDVALNVQKNQHENISKHLSVITRELSAHKGIKNVIEDSLIVSDVYDKCPTCNQSVSDDLMKEEGVTIEKYTLDENISYLKGQSDMIKRSISSLADVIKEKEIMRKYYLNKQRQYEEEIKIILRELIEDDRDYSDTDSLIRVRLEKKVNDFRYGEQRFERYIQVLKEIALEYQDVLKQKAALEGSKQEDLRKLETFETIFKTDYLFPFGYSSNQAFNIYIQKNEPFKYFPVFKTSSTSDLPQSIKTNSSASDFVRTIWAYSISLLVNAPNHPGILLLDEPGQHSVKSVSLKTLFEKTAAIKNRQTIILTSFQKVLSRPGDTQVDRMDLQDLITNLTERTDYHIYRLPTEGKSINIL
jgi:hypothetical protein